MPSQTITEDTQHKAERRVQRASLRVLVVSALIMLFELIGGCAALPSGVQRPVSQAMVDERTSLVQAATAAMPAGAAADQSGLRLIPDGDQALASRIALIRRAERSLDVQTYHLAADGTGALFLSELRHAAARGVRVRLLVDDLYAAGHDPLYAALAAHANVQVRMFNPLPVRNASFGGRIALSMHEFSRINRRMHNKLFIADGAFAVAGGRNIADEYYMRSAQANFVDMDVLAAGPAVRELAAVFDSYWNSQQAYPIGTLTEAVDAARFDTLNAAPADEPAYTKLDRLGRGAIVDQLQRGTLLLHAARVQVLADQPSKAAGAATRTTRAAASELFAAAQSELMIVSPYFVPGDAGMAMLRQVQERGATVDVTTNSLGATDEPLVHAGYSKYRLSLLKMGVKVQELGATLSQKTNSLGRLPFLQRPPARQAGGDRRPAPVHRLDEHGRPQRPPQHRARPGDRQPRTGRRSGRAVPRRRAGRDLPPATGRRRAHRVAGHRRRPRRHAHQGTRPHGGPGHPVDADDRADQRRPALTSNARRQHRRPSNATFNSLLTPGRRACATITAR